MSKNVNKINEVLAEALDEGLEILLYDSFDGTTYSIDDANIEDGVCLIEVCVNGIDEEDSEYIDIDLEEESDSIYEAIDLAYEEFKRDTPDDILYGGE